MKQLFQNKLVLAALSGILLTAGSVPFEMPFLMFIALVPLMQLNTIIIPKKWGGFQFYILSVLAILIWNIGTMNWLLYADFNAGIATIISNALLLSIPLILYRKLNVFFNNRWGRTSLIAAFIAFEYFHFNWELACPWLTLGNSFATYPSIIQWYSVTGVLGGSFWILSINYFVFRALTGPKENRIGKLRLAGLGIILPIILSVTVFQNQIESNKEIEIVTIQPNFDSYTEKFGGIPFREQLKINLDLTHKFLTDSTQFIFWPETAIHERGDRINYNSINSYSQVIHARTVLSRKNKNINLISGITGHQVFNKIQSAHSSFNPYGSGYKEAYNSAIHISPKMDSVSLYHKSRLVPIVERMPFKGMINKLGAIANYFVSLGIQKEREIFYSENGNVAPAICFESVFAEYMTEFVDKGADFISILTNDSWWKYPDQTKENKPMMGSSLGYKQHFHYARLRAIENNRYVVRSANTGISGIIDNKGNIVSATEYWKRDAIRGKVQLNKEYTHYTINGDFLGRWSLTLTIILSLLMIVNNKVIKKRD